MPPRGISAAVLCVFASWCEVINHFCKNGTNSVSLLLIRKSQHSTYQKIHDFESCASTKLLHRNKKDGVFSCGLRFFYLGILLF